MKTVIRLSSLALAAVFYAGCGAGVPDGVMEAEAGEPGVARTQSAAVSCYAGTCDFKDPGASGCEADAITVASSDIRTSSGGVIGRIAIRYSAACRAVWARSSSTTLSLYYLRAEIYRGGTTAQAASVEPETALRSPMLGVLTSGTLFDAVGYAGKYYNDLGNASGRVSGRVY